VWVKAIVKNGNTKVKQKTDWIHNGWAINERTKLLHAYDFAWYRNRYISTYSRQSEKSVPQEAWLAQSVLEQVLWRSGKEGCQTFGNADEMFRQDMNVNLFGCSDWWMTEYFRNEVDVNTGKQKRGCKIMAKRVRPEKRYADSFCDSMALQKQAVRCHWFNFISILEVCALWQVYRVRYFGVVF